MAQHTYTHSLPIDPHDTLLSISTLSSPNQPRSHKILHTIFPLLPSPLRLALQPHIPSRTTLCPHLAPFLSQRLRTRLANHTLNHFYLGAGAFVTVVEVGYVGFGV